MVRFSLLFLFSVISPSVSFAAALEPCTTQVDPSIVDRFVAAQAEQITARLGMLPAVSTHNIGHDTIAEWARITFDHLTELSADGEVKARILKKVYEWYGQKLKHALFKWAYVEVLFRDKSVCFYGVSGKMVIFSPEGDVYYDQLDLVTKFTFAKVDGQFVQVPKYSHIKRWKSPATSNP